MTRRWQTTVVAALVVGSAALASCSPATGPLTGFATVPATGWGADGAAADLGLRPVPDALSFPNAPDPGRVFDAGDLVAMFGPEGVCEEPTGPCVVRPQAQQWADKVAASVRGGVCEGMAVLTLDRFAARSTPPSARLQPTGTLERSIMRLFATQFLPHVGAEAAQWHGRSLRDVADELDRRLQPEAEPVTMGLYVPGAGHAVVPYAMDRPDSDRAVVWVYDPNWPGDNRFVELDLAGDRWRFPFAGADPVADDQAWTGNAGAIDLIGLTAREAPFAEPFTGAGTGRPLLTVTATGRTWSATTVTDGTTVAGPTSLPGGDSVTSVVRGGFGAHTVLATMAPDAPVRVTGDDYLRATVETPAGSVAVIIDGGGGFTVTGSDDGVSVTDVTGDGTVVVAAPGGMVRVAAGNATTVSLDTGGDRTRVRFRTGGMAQTGEVTLDGARTDVVVDADGGVRTTPPPQWPESVRTPGTGTRPAATGPGVVPATTPSTTVPAAAGPTSPGQASPGQAGPQPTPGPGNPTSTTTTRPPTTTPPTTRPAPSSTSTTRPTTTTAPTPTTKPDPTTSTTTGNGTTGN